MIQSLTPNAVFLLIFALVARFTLTLGTDGMSENGTTTEAISEAERNLTLEECSNPSELTKQQCCSSTLGVDSAIAKCLILHQKEMPKEKELNPTILMRYYTCLVVCIYETKKYIGKGDSLDMKAIKADANNQHPGDTKARDYMIGMYKHCGKQAAVDWADLDKKTSSNTLLYKSCQPYFMLVFVCTMKYGKISCPHFKWHGSNNTMQVCEDMKEKCEHMNK